MKSIPAVVLVLVLLVAGVAGPGTSLLFLLPAVLGVGLVGLCGVTRIGSGTAYRVSGAAVASVVLFFAYVIWRAAASEVEYLARPDLYLAVGGLIMFVGGALFCEATVWRKVVVYVLAVLVAGNAVVGAYQFLADEKFSVLEPLGFFRNLHEGDRQAGGFFNLGNHLAGFLEAALFPVLGVALFGKVKLPWRLLLAAVVMAGLVAVVLSTSRGGWVSTVAGLVVFVLLALVVTVRKMGKREVAIGLGVLVVGAAALGGVAVLGKGVSDEAFEGGIAEQQEFRFSLWEMALEQHALSPLTGTGARTYEVYSRKFMPDSIYFLGNHSGLDAVFTHNDYLQLLAEYGLVGLVLAVVALVAVGWSALAYLWWFRTTVYRETGRTSSTRLGVVLGACGALGAYAVHSALDFNLHVSANALTVALLVGFLANPGRLRSTGGSGDAGGDRKPVAGRPVAALLVVLAAGGGLWTVWSGLPLARSEILVEQGRRTARAGEFLTAVGLYGRALELDPGNPVAHQWRGAAFTKLGDEETLKPIARSYWTKAVEAFDRSRQLHPHDIYLLVALGDVLSKLGAADSAQEVYEEAIEWGPNHRRTWVAYGLHLMTSGKLEEAKAALERALELEWYGTQPRKVKLWLRLIDRQLEKRAGATAD